MKKRVDPLGRLLLRSGVLDEDQLADALDSQRRTLPLASLCLALGLAEEEPLVRVLSRQRGVPGLVLGRCAINLTVLRGVPKEIALRHGIMPVLEDASRVFVAVEDPADNEVLREIGFLKGKAVVPHVALQIAIARAIRGGFAAAERGEPFWHGEHATQRETGDSPGRMHVVSDLDDLRGAVGAPPDTLREDPPSHADELTDITKELFDVEQASSDDSSFDDTTGQSADPAGRTGRYHEGDNGSMAGDDSSASIESHSSLSAIELQPSSSVGVIDLDDGEARPRAPTGPARVLVVDDDFATRHLIVKMLGPDGYTTDTAAGGMEAVKRLRASPPDLVILDIMLPEIDGFQICRSIKTSHKYRHIPVILLSAVIDSGRVTQEVLQRYGAEAYFEKPINTDRLRRKIAELLGARAPKPPGAHRPDTSFEKSLELYRVGDIDAAIVTLRAGVEVDPLSTKHHFVLANLLQKKNQVYEAIDEYEATVNLKPDYFPALSRLAYLYYKKGFSAKAIETWRRSLPHCPDPTLRQNIELFMRRLIADMQQES